MAEAVILSAVRTPDRALRRRALGRAAGRPRRPRHRGGRRAGRRGAGRDRGRLLRRRQPGRRGQPQRGAHGRAACRAAQSVAGVTVNRLCASGLSAVVGARTRSARATASSSSPAAPSPCRARRSSLRSRTYGDGDDLGHDARLALSEPAHGGDVPARVDGRDRRERGRALRESRARTRTPSHFRATAAGRPPRRPAASPTSSSRSARSTATSIPRPDTSLEKLATLKPAFREGGTITAGNASGINDGAAALVVASEEKARELGVEPLGRFVASAVAGVDPRYMGVGPSRRCRSSSPARGSRPPTSISSS